MSGQEMALKTAKVMMKLYSSVSTPSSMYPMIDPRRVESDELILVSFEFKVREVKWAKILIQPTFTFESCCDSVKVVPRYPRYPLSAFFCPLRKLAPNANSQDTASGRRQQRREIEFLIDFKCLHPDAANIVGVVEARIAPFDMLLMRKESQTLTSMLESAISIDVVAIAK